MVSLLKLLLNGCVFVFVCNFMMCACMWIVVTIKNVL